MRLLISLDLLCRMMKKRGGSISSCLSRPSSDESVINMKLLSANSSSPLISRKRSESSQYSSIDKSWENSFEICCRICHDNEDEEKLMTACKCSGSIKYIHHGCLLRWISRSGDLSCELCKYNFQVQRTRRKKFSEVSREGVVATWQQNQYVCWEPYSVSVNAWGQGRRSVGRARGATRKVRALMAEGKQS